MATFTPIQGDPFAASSDAGAPGVSYQTLRTVRDSIPMQRSVVRNGVRYILDGDGTELPADQVKPDDFVEDGKVWRIPDEAKLTPVDADPFAEAEVDPVEDGAKSLGSGLVKGVGGTLDTVMAAFDPARAIGLRERLIGADVRAKLEAAAQAQGVSLAPEDVDRAVRDALSPGAMTIADHLGARYKPQTIAGRYLKTGGEMAPNALMPGGIWARMLSVAAPAVASEGAADVAKSFGFGETGQEVARLGGAVVAGLATGGRSAMSPQAETEAAEALAEMGINVRTLPAEATERLGSLLRSGRSPRESAVAVAADLPVPVPMTRGQMSGQPGQQLSENLALRGAKGSAAARHMRGFVDEQQQALRGNVEALADNIAGGRAPTRGAGGEAVSSRLNQMYDEGKQSVDDAYDAARAGDEGSWLPREQAAVLGQQMREGVRAYDIQRVPAVGRELEAVDRIAGSGQLQVRDLFDARARLTSLSQSSDNVEAGAASAAARSLDTFIGDKLAADLIQGDPASVKRWQDAIAKRREFGKLFEGDDLIERLTQRVDRGGERRTLRVDAGDATNYILGRSDLGFVGRQNLYRDLTRLRSVLGEASPEWNALRAEVFQRLASAGEGGVEHGSRQFSGVKFAKAWDDLRRRDPRLAGAMFTEQERNTIERFAAVASRVTAPVKGGDNPSNTAVTAMRLLGKLRFLRGLPLVKDISNEIEVQINLGSARAATTGQPSRAGSGLPARLPAAAISGVAAQPEPTERQQ